jgi:hypothetical protein
MSFIIQGLDPALFGAVRHQKQGSHGGQPVERHIVTDYPGFPCRITLDDVPVGQAVLLLSYRHHEATSPYAQSGPIYISESNVPAGHYIDEIPPALARRTLSLRAYDQGGNMIDAHIVEGAHAADAIRRLFNNPNTDRIDAHNATRGCFAAHIRRYTG